MKKLLTEKQAKTLLINGVIDPITCFELLSDQIKREGIVEGRKLERKRLLLIAKESLGGHSFTSEPINVAKNLLKALTSQRKKENENTKRCATRDACCSKKKGG